ncbi:hypothetical protein M127_5798 [Bacteroides fragilis str. S6L5]|nr:hypothetical protein M127_5798 [Bacteroides fragilis str. S6L5]
MLPSVILREEINEEKIEDSFCDKELIIYSAKMQESSHEDTESVT